MNGQNESLFQSIETTEDGINCRPMSGKLLNQSKEKIKGHNKDLIHLEAVKKAKKIRQI